jgi:hypothetical protein
VSVANIAGTLLNSVTAESLIVIAIIQAYRKMISVGRHCVRDFGHAINLRGAKRQRLYKRVRQIVTALNSYRRGQVREYRFTQSKYCPVSFVNINNSLLYREIMYARIIENRIVRETQAEIINNLKEYFYDY